MNRYCATVSIYVTASSEVEANNLIHEMLWGTRKMSPYERLLNYAHTMNGTYLGSGCNWDLVTRLGIKKW